MDLKFDTIIKLPLLQKVMIVVGINLLVAAIFFQFVYNQKEGEITNLRNQRYELFEEIKDNRKKSMDIPKYEKEKVLLAAKLKRAVAKLPNEKEIDSLLDSINQAAEVTSFKVLSFKPKGENTRGFYAEVSVAMKGEGTFENFFRFCDEISKLQRIVNIEGIKIKLSGKTVGDGTPVLKVDFMVTTFRFIPGKGVSK